jgi:CelD/BcsL family acetyltransferase involved in cellulose biosynthesis
VGAFYRLACSVSRKTYQHRLLDAGLPPTAAFEAELLIQARRDAMRGYLLFYRGEAIAYAYGTAGSDCLRFRYIGYDPAYSDLSPGIVLLGEALRSAIDERRFAIIDFGSGAARYKRDFATGSLCSATVFLFRPKLRSLALVLAHHLCTAASDSCVMLLSAFGVKARIKRYFRVRRAPGLARTLP